MKAKMDDDKIRITVSLDPDVAKKIADVAKAQRTTVSALINHIIADRMGLIPKDSIWGAVTK